MKRGNWVCKGDSFEFDLYGEAEGLCSNPLIHFTIIKGLAVGLFIRYGLLRLSVGSLGIESALFSDEECGRQDLTFRLNCCNDE